MFFRLKNYFSLSVALSALVLGGCGGAQHDDLQQFMAETKRRPAGSIEPLPSFSPYEAFIYAAATLRSPFEPPVKVIDPFISGPRSDVTPDLNRVKEYLEEFPVQSLTLVGSISKGGTLWALINDGNGGIHRVREGNYMGRDHARVISAGKTQLTLVEIVSDGLNGWVERPRTLELQVQD
ncbi:pilus assembly protein PilP [Marinibactrum halimedae]|uniref:pilus assembly protein PilP n=1 Tax=Marinibactrum halimedae TaxID=1444977 RepID=UPI001E3A4785|nr:pilus assembly protein PilP [Marinibactrum halimedae]MCD9459742.1 pilus assembly protein PilP [Marinibactrum halimedae]